MLGPESQPQHSLQLRQMQTRQWEMFPQPGFVIVVGYNKDFAQNAMYVRTAGMCAQEQTALQYHKLI